MRNSLLPILGVLLAVGLGLALMRPQGTRGLDGPRFEPGILRLPKRGPTPAMPVAGEDAVVLAGDPDATAWTAVVVAGADQQATTRAVQYALGEALVAAGVVAILDPLPDPGRGTLPVPLPSNRRLEVRTLRAVLPERPEGRLEAVLTVTLSEPGIPAGHPGAALPAIRSPAVATITHVSQGAAGGWPERWAGSGRTMAQAVLARLLPQGIRATTAAPGWGSQIPLPPQVPELRWGGCFQGDRIRGWSGRVEGRETVAKSGSREPAIAPVERILASGRWLAQPDSGSHRLWQRLRDGEIAWFSIRDSGDGWDIAWWQERR